MKFAKFTHLPLIVLLSFNIIVGLLSYKDFGISWDEPLFYDYAHSIRSAYSPTAFTSEFDFNTVFGKSSEDHKYYGPAYLLTAYPLVQILKNVSSSTDFQAWHLINFLFFQIGLLYFYLLVLRWLKPLPSFFATAFFAWQPILWGHAFINPKDIPFLVFCLITIYYGYNFVDETQNNNRWFSPATIIYGFVLGFTSAIRVIGPVIGIVVFFYLVVNKKWEKIPQFLVSSIIAVIVMFVFWPFLWSNPIQNFLAVLKHMSNNPTELAVLYNAQLYRANEMPISYIPKMLFITLTEPTWFLIFIGELYFLFLAIKRKINWHGIVPITFLFVLLLSYILIIRPSVYDGFRHFFFITPILFILVGFSFQYFSEISHKYISIPLSLILILPGLMGIVSLHPYEYSYYNQFIGGIKGADRTYELDYWLTCYQPAIAWYAENHPGETLFVQREIQLAEAYQSSLLLSDDLMINGPNQKPKYILTHIRGNLDLRSNYRKEPIIQAFGKNETDFCMIKKVE